MSTTSPRTTAAARFEFYLTRGLQHPTHRLAGFGGQGATPCPHPSDPGEAVITDRVVMASSANSVHSEARR